MNSKYIKILAFLGVGVTLTSCNFINGFQSNVKEETYLYVRSNATYEEVLDSLKSKLKNIESFQKYADGSDYASHIRPGKYKLEAGESNRNILDKLMDGKQEEVKLMIKNEPTIFHLARSVSKNIEADSASIVNAIVDWANQQNDPTLNAETVKRYFVPNTYNYWWATSAETFVEKMLKEFDKVWTEERAQKAVQLGLSQLEVYTLASIVQLEASKVDEQPKVARAYLNRLAKNMRLEADPTSVYAYKLQNGFDQRIQRVYRGHLATPSDYNTYRVKGLPPAPICLPNTTAVDAVLNPDSHDFIYFCADPDRPGYHSFTNDFEEHKKNAAKYRAWLEANNIR